MRIVLAIEGTDGAGKTSLVRFLKNFCAQQGQRFTGIGRRGNHVGPLVAKLSRVLDEEARQLLPQAEVAVRIAREYERARLAAAVPEGLVILDRFVLTVLSLIRLHGLNMDALLPLLREIAARAHLFATVFVQCPFEVAANRVITRNPNNAMRKKGNETILQRQALLMEEEFLRGKVTGQQWLVDNSGEQQLAEEQLLNYLASYLRKENSLP